MCVLSYDGTRAERERVRGAFRAVHQRRMPASADSDRRGALPARRGGDVEHYHAERNHQGIGNRLISDLSVIQSSRSADRVLANHKV